MVNMGTSDIEIEIGEKIDNKSRYGKGGQKAYQDNERNLFTDFGTDKVPKFHEVILAGFVSGLGLEWKYV